MKVQAAIGEKRAGTTRPRRQLFGPILPSSSTTESLRFSNVFHRPESFWPEGLDLSERQGGMLASGSGV